MGNVLGVLTLIAAIGCGGMAYLEAGGGHGDFRADRLLDGGDATMAFGFAVGAFVLSLMFFVAGNLKKKPAPAPAEQVKPPT